MLTFSKLNNNKMMKLNNLKFVHNLYVKKKIKKL